MLDFLNAELLFLIMTYLHPLDMLEFRLTSSHYLDSLEAFAESKLCSNPGWIEVLPKRLHGLFDNTFTKYFSAACYWMDLPFTARTSVAELLCCKVDFPLSLPRNKQIAICERWLGEMSIVKHQMLRSESCTKYPGVHRELDELLSPSGLEEVDVLYEQLQEEEMMMEELDLAPRVFRHGADL